MRRPSSRVWLAPAAILIALLPVASAASIELPRWQVGDEWTFTITVVENGATVQTGERHVVVTERGSFDLRGTTREAYTLSVWQNLTGTPASSHQDVRDVLTGHLIATRSGAGTHAAYDPCADLAYPLEVGKTWTDACDLGFGPVETSYSVVGGETLALPAGSFDTLTVDAVGNDALRVWVSARACGKVAEFSQANDLATYVNLTAFRCASALATTPTPTVTPGGGGPTGSATPTPPTSRGGVADDRSAGNSTRDTETPGLGAGALLLALLVAARGRKPS